MKKKTGSKLNGDLRRQAEEHLKDREGSPAGSATEEKSMDFQALFHELAARR